MALENPAFTRNPAFAANAATTAAGGAAVANNVTAQQLNDIYNQPSTPATGEVMTVEDTIAKTFGTFVLLLAGAAVGWLTADTVPFLWIGAALVGFVLALVNTFKKEPSAPLILAYSAVQGVFLGGISSFYEQQYPGIVIQAVIGTFAVVGVTPRPVRQRQDPRVGSRDEDLPCRPRRLPGLLGRQHLHHDLRRCRR